MAVVDAVVVVVVVVLVVVAGAGCGGVDATTKCVSGLILGS